ncbi:MAG: hypothetical protein R2830_19180 [Saprospiraceae bacterium]
MKCNCIQKIEKQLIGTQHDGKTVAAARFTSAAIIFADQKAGKIDAVTTSEVCLVVDLGASKKTVAQHILHLYCPFCGTRIREAVRTCRACGCTDEDCSLCIKKTGSPCHWVEEDLCSACT